MAENATNSQQGGTTCPICGKGILKRAEDRIYCSESKPEKVGKEWINNGTCNFVIFRKQKLFGRELADADIKKLLAGGSLKDKNGNLLEFDKESNFFLKVTFAPKQEDRNF